MKSAEKRIEALEAAAEERKKKASGGIDEEFLEWWKKSNEEWNKKLEGGYDPASDPNFYNISDPSPIGRELFEAFGTPKWIDGRWVRPEWKAGKWYYPSF